MAKETGPSYARAAAEKRFAMIVVINGEGITDWPHTCPIATKSRRVAPAPPSASEIPIASQPPSENSFQVIGSATEYIETGAPLIALFNISRNPAAASTPISFNSRSTVLLTLEVLALALPQCYVEFHSFQNKLKQNDFLDIDGANARGVKYMRF